MSHDWRVTSKFVSGGAVFSECVNELGEIEYHSFAPGNRDLWSGRQLLPINPDPRPAHELVGPLPDAVQRRVNSVMAEEVALRLLREELCRRK